MNQNEIKETARFLRDKIQIPVEIGDAEKIAYEFEHYGCIAEIINPELVSVSPCIN